MADFKTPTRSKRPGRLTTETRGFIQKAPAKERVVGTLVDERFTQIFRRAPNQLKVARPIGGGGAGGGAMWPTDKEAGHVAPNLRLLLVLLEMEHNVVSGGGVPQSWIFWSGDSNVADVQTQPDLSLPLPGPGQSWSIGLGSVIYEGINLDACGGGGGVSFPVSLESWVVEEENNNGINTATGDEIGRNTVMDNSTVDTLGTYVFNYTIRANGSNDGVSDFTLRGEVRVQCVNDSTVET